MNITITGRRLEVTPSLRDYAEKKVSRLEKYFNQVIDARAVMRVEKINHIFEMLINGDGVQFYALEQAGDMYSAIDLLVDKIEKQIIRYKEKVSDHKAAHPGIVQTMEAGADVGFDCILNQVSNKPKNEIEAYLEMKMNNGDFILFKKGIDDIKSDIDYSDKNYAVIYKSSVGYKMVEIPYEMIQSNTFSADKFMECDLEIISDSPAKPKIDFRKNAGCGDIMKMTLGDALKKLMESPADFIPFFNTETNYLNIVYKKGKQYEVMVPAF